jgi:hypothetical protein
MLNFSLLCFGAKVYWFFLWLATLLSPCIPYLFLATKHGKSLLLTKNSTSCIYSSFFYVSKDYFVYFYYQGVLSCLFCLICKRRSLLLWLFLIHTSRRLLEEKFLFSTPFFNDKKLARFKSQMHIFSLAVGLR